MAKKEFMFKGKSLQELQRMTIDEFAEYIPSRARRSLKRGFTEEQKKLLDKVKSGKDIKTHCRDMVIVPDMVNKNIRIHNGKDYVPVTITGDMLGHYLGEFAMTRKRVGHSAPGVGATRSSASVSVR